MSIQDSERTLISFNSGAFQSLSEAKLDWLLSVQENLKASLVFSVVRYPAESNSMTILTFTCW